MKTIQDDRTEQEKETHIYFVQAYDKFLSGWGNAKEGKSYFTWACSDKEDWDVAHENMKARTEMRYVTTFIGKDALKTRLNRTNFVHYRVKKWA